MAINNFLRPICSHEITLFACEADTLAEALEPDINDISPMNDPACKVAKILSFCLILTAPDIISFNSGVFCYNGTGKMNDIDLDGGGGIVSRRYKEENSLPCNFGGIGLGSNGEMIQLVTVDTMDIDNIGFIHCDAQGAENFIFSKAINTIKKYRPVILYENNQDFGKYYYDNVCENYPSYKEESKFDVRKYCMQDLNYSKCIDCFNGSIDTLLIP